MTPLVRRYHYTTFRTLGTAAAAQKLLTVELPASARAFARLRRLTFVYIFGAASGAYNVLKAFRNTSTLPTGGTALAACKRHTQDDDAVGLIVRGATASDAGAATAITATATGGAFAGWMSPFMSTAAGQAFPHEFEIYREDGDQALILRPGESLQRLAAGPAHRRAQGFAVRG